MASETPRVAGVWHAAGSSRAAAAGLTVDGGAGEVTVRGGEAVLTRSPVAAVQLSPRVGSIPRRLTFPDASVFETRDNDAIDRLFAASARRAGVVHELERFRPRLLVFVALVIALCFVIYRFAVPVLVEAAVAMTPPIIPQMMSRGALASLDRTVLEESALEPARQAEIEAGFRKLAALAPRGPDGFTLNFRKGGAIGPNAFALPDGTIVLTDELVAMARDDDAVLGVLAHEIGHVEAEHALRRLYRAAGIAALIMMIGGDIGAGAEDVLVQGAALMSLSYSRRQESEADRMSVELMLKAGMDPAALVRFLELMRERFGGDRPDFLSTHPATAGRIEAVRKYAEELGSR